MATRWITETYFKSSDHEMLQIVTVYPEGINKESVKKETKSFKNKRSILIKGYNDPIYNFKG